MGFLHNIWRSKEVRTVEDKLRTYLHASDLIVAFGLFSFVFSQKLRLMEFFGTNNPLELANKLILRNFWPILLVYIYDMATIIILSIVTFFWYLLYKGAVKTEIDIFNSLFSKINPPDDWTQLTGRAWIPLLSVLIIAAYLGLAFFVDNITMYCVIVIILNIFDIRGNILISQNLYRHFHDGRYQPHPQDILRKFIMRRREVANRYWIEKPQIERIGLMMLANMAAFINLFSESIIGVKSWPELSYIIVIGAIIFNEIAMIVWRADRNRDLAQIDADERKFNASLRLGEHI